MFARHSRIAAASLSLFVLAPLAAGCAAETAAPGGEGREEPAAQTSEALAYAPLGFARVTATGALVTSFDSTTTVWATTAHAAGTGRYTVTFPGLAANDGNAQVTAEGDGSERCRLVGWYPSAGNEQVTVQCSTPSGAPADSAFAVSFFRYAFPTTTNTFPTEVAYSWVSNGAASTWYDHNSSGHHNVVTPGPAGTYTVFIPQASYQNASVMVSAYGGASANFCQVGGWYPASGGTNLTVYCFDPSGAPANSDFAFWYSLTGPTMDQQGAHAWFSGGAPSASYSSGMGKYDCDSVAITGSVASGVATVNVSGDLGTWDANPYRRASFVVGYGYAPTYCKVPSMSAWGAAPSSTSSTQVRCYSATGTPVTPTFTFTELTSDAAGPC
jgi:hypothetical protein